MPVRIVTDSSSNIPAELAAEYDITVVPLHKMKSGKDRTTAGLSALELVAVYARQLERGGDEGVVAIHLSKELSSTWSNAVTAAGIFDKLVAVVDTNSIGFSLGFAALAAARAAQEGADIETCRHMAVDALQRSQLFLYVHRVDELRRSGRMSATISIMSTALAMRPILTLHDGRLEVAAKTRTLSKAIERLEEFAVSLSAEQPCQVWLQHFEAREGVDELARRLVDALPEGSTVDVVEMDSVLAVHSGPGAVAMSVLVDDEAIEGETTVSEHRGRGHLATDLFGRLKAGESKGSAEES